MSDAGRGKVALGYFLKMPLDDLSRFFSLHDKHPGHIQDAIVRAWRLRSTGTGETSDHEGATHPSEEPEGSIQVEYASRVYTSDGHLLGVVDLVSAQEGTFQISRMVKPFWVRRHYSVAMSEIHRVIRGAVFLTIRRSEFFDRPYVMET
jgi:hypothetical protein